MWYRVRLRKQGVGIVGVSRIGHSGMLSYFADYAAQRDLICLTVCQSDPMAVPFGGTEPFLVPIRLLLARQQRMTVRLFLIWQRLYKPGENIRRT